MGQKDYHHNVSFRLLDSVEALGKPLALLGIKGFYFMRLFPDHTFANLLPTTNAPYAELYFDQFYTKQYDQKTVSDHMYISEEISLWDLNPNNLIWSEGRALGLGHGATLTKIRSDYTDVFCFYGGETDAHLNQLYLERSYLLQQFAQYFMEEGADLIRAAEKERYIIPACYRQDDVLPSPTVSEAHFLRRINKSRVRVECDGERHYLTMREAQVLSLLMTGLTYKTAAKALSISDKTVAIHVDNMRERLGLSKLSQLIQVGSSAEVDAILNALKTKGCVDADC